MYLSMRGQTAPAAVQNKTGTWWKTFRPRYRPYMTEKRGVSGTLLAAAAVRTYVKRTAVVQCQGGLALICITAVYTPVWLHFMQRLLGWCCCCAGVAGAGAAAAVCAWRYCFLQLLIIISLCGWQFWSVGSSRRVLLAQHE